MCRQHVPFFSPETTNLELVCDLVHTRRNVNDQSRSLIGQSERGTLEPWHHPHVLSGHGPWKDREFAINNWTIRRRVLASFAVIVALMLLTAAVGYTRLQRVQHDAESLRADSLPSVYNAGDIRSAAFLHFALLEKFLAESSASRKEGPGDELQDARAQLDSRIEKGRASIVVEREHELFSALTRAQETYARATDQVIKTRADPAADSSAVRIADQQVESAFAGLKSAIVELSDFERANADASVRQIEDDTTGAVLALLVSSVAALLLATASGLLLMKAITRPLSQLVGAVNQVRQGDFTSRLRSGRRDEFGTLADGFDRMSDELTALVGQVQKSGLQVDTSVTEIAATAKQQQATASEIAATTTEIGATSREISATSKDLVRTMNEVSGVAERSAELAGNSQAGLTRMEETMRHVIEAAGAINSKLAVLSEKAGNISQVVTTITKVADQTNLLSLNAAIEAEKAGEYGRGFAVVSTEIRRLADQTAVATYDIEQMVKEIQSAVAAGVMGMDKFSEEVRRGASEIEEAGVQLTQLIQQVQALAPRFEAVTEGMQAQATGAEQISQALVQLGEASQQTVESLRQSSAAMQDLTQVASGLRSGVSRFRLEGAT